MSKNGVFFNTIKELKIMPVHKNSIKNLRGGRKLGSKNKTTLAKKKIEKLLNDQEDIKEKAKRINLSQDDLVEVLISTKENLDVPVAVEGERKFKRPNKEILKPSIQKNTLLTKSPQDVDNPRKVTLKEFLFGFND